LKLEYKIVQAEMKPIYAEVKQLWNIRFSAEKTLDTLLLSADSKERQSRKQERSITK